MPKIDFPSIPNAQDFSPLPEGEYLCQLVEIDESITQYNDEMWKLRFKVIEGKHKGRIILDNMVFSEAAMGRVKLICSRLGLDTSIETNITPDLLQGHKCYISVEIQDYEDNKGETKKRNAVPFTGYRLFEDTEESQGGENIEDEDDLPF